MTAVKNFKTKMWSFVTLPEMFYNDDEYLILKFKSEEERAEILLKGPYTIHNLPMVLLELRKDFSIERDMLRTVPIWVKFPQLPLYF